MSTTPRLNKLLDENSEAGMLPIDRYSAVIAFAAGIERELTAEKERSARLEKALRAIANDDDEEFVTPVHIIRETARAALGDSNG